jgi:hypothetical protein
MNRYFPESHSLLAAPFAALAKPCTVVAHVVFGWSDNHAVTAAVALEVPTINLVVPSRFVTKYRAFE